MMSPHCSIFPIGGRFWTTLVVSMSLACQIVARDFRVSDVAVQEDFGVNKGAHLCMSWLQKMYNELVVDESYEVAARAYMLHIITCTLFADKSDVYIDAQYVCLFSRLEETSWARGGVALPLLYTTLRVTTVFETK